MSDIDDALWRAEHDRYGGFDQSGFLAQCIKDRRILAAEVERLRGVRWAVERQHQPADFEPGMCVTCLVTMPCPTLVALG